MCLAVPMMIREILGGNQAVAELDGARFDIDVSLVDNPAAGDFVIIHAGFAIERLDRAEADARLALFDELARSHTA